MNTSYHRPTHVFKEGAFNATQVRLYGAHGSTSKIIRKNTALGEITIEVILKKDGKPIKTKKDGVYFIRIGQNKDIPAFIVAANLERTEKVRSIGVIYGYAYEGHCYDLPKPVIMLLPELPELVTPADDCGYDKKFGAGYRVWVVDKLSECDHVEINSGFVEQLVLEANLPGRRSPSMYSANMQLAHRGGRLNE